MTAEEARALLARPLCWCGRRKFAGHPLCGRCWQTLDGDLRTEMRQKVGFGFEQSYEFLQPLIARHVRPLKAVPAPPPPAKPAVSARSLRGS